MSEQNQITNMQLRVTRLAMRRWNVTLAGVMSVFLPAGVLSYIERNFGLFHMEGDDAVLDDVEEYLSSQGVNLGATL